MTKLIFEGNFIAKLLPCNRKCKKKIAKIFACGELNLLDFEQVNVVAPKRFGKTEMDLIRIQRFIIFDWMSHKNRFNLQNLKFVAWTKCD